MKEVLIRKAIKDDIQEIADNVIAMAIEGSMVKLDPKIALAGVSSLFSKPELGFYIVATIDKKIIGSLVIVFEWSDWRNGVHWWIHSIYVAPEHRKQGIYKQMYSFVQEEFKLDSGSISIKLSVNKNNKIARAAYESLGMKESSSIIYHAPALE